MKIDEAKDYFPVQIEVFPLDSFLSFNLYIQKTDGSYALYRERNLAFSAETKEKLLSFNVEYLYIQQTDKEKYQEFLEEHLSAIVAHPKASLDYKAKAVYDTASKIVMDVLQKPDIGENIIRTVGVAQSIVDFLMQGREQFFHMLSRTSRDYYTFSHSVHVCTYGVVLAKRVGYSMASRNQLDDLATGILLHDIGKSRIPQKILSKPGPLTSEEWAEVRKHPATGLEMARNISTVKPLSYIPILQHHEKVDGSGYPNGVPGNEIHIFGKITAIVDGFDAMTTNRSYARGKTYFEALKEMLSMADMQLDKALLMEFIKMLTGR